MTSESTPLIPRGVTPPSDASGDKPTVYFLERRDSHLSHGATASVAGQDAEEIETIPEGSTVEAFEPRPVGSLAGSSREGHRKKKSHGWLAFFKNVNKKSNAFASTGGGGGAVHIDQFPRSAPVKIDPKVFFANERTFLAWMHVAVILAGASVAIVAFTDTHHSAPHQLYSVILLPVSISFILYAMMQYSRRATLIRRKAPGPYADIVGPTVLTGVLMLSIVIQFSIKLYTLM
ncbi:hypothetical protein ACHAXT_001552 [Thalassiosira profunda]